MRALVCAALLLAATACDGTDRAEAREMESMTGGDPDRGRAIIRKYGCQSCHTIPGVAGGDARVGPPLAGVASRSYIAGVLPNAPDNMIAWIMDPRRVDSLTAMPDVGVTKSDARHIAAYLYTLDAR